MGKYVVDITGTHHRGDEGGVCVGVTLTRYTALRCDEQYRAGLEQAAAQGQQDFDAEASLRFGGDYSGLPASEKAEVRALFL